MQRYDHLYTDRKIERDYPDEIIKAFCLTLNNKLYVYW